MAGYTGTRKLASGRTVTFVDGVAVPKLNSALFANAAEFDEAAAMQAKERAEDEAVAEFKMNRDAAALAGPSAPRKDLPHGTYTLVKPDGSHRTIQIGVAGWTKEKATVASYLSGPDNEISYKAFAFLKPGGKFNLFNRYKGNSQLAQDLDHLLNRADVRGAHEQFLSDAEEYALRSDSCMRCGRKLTVPASLHRGLGPVCAGIEGV